KRLAGFIGQIKGSGNLRLLHLPKRPGPLSGDARGRFRSRLASTGERPRESSLATGDGPVFRAGPRPATRRALRPHERSFLYGVTRLIFLLVVRPGRFELPTSCFGEQSDVLPVFQNV